MKLLPAVDCAGVPMPVKPDGALPGLVKLLKLMPPANVTINVLTADVETPETNGTTEDDVSIWDAGKEPLVSQIVV